MCACLCAEIVSTLARNVKTCVLRLCPDRVCFVIMEKGPAGGGNIWCELTQVQPRTPLPRPLRHHYVIPQSNIFDEYRIEGKDERNEIYLELSLEQLSRALRTSLSAQVLKMKLAKRQGACLLVEIVQVPSIYSECC